MLNPEGDVFRSFSACGLEHCSSLVIAISGGSDSTALLLLLKDYRDRFARGTRLLAATVDHGLRPDSAAEAAAVADLAERLGIAHRTLRWTEPKPASGLAAAAREARYDFLAQAAREAAADAILTAHTAEDQAETVFMRMQRGQGFGLSGMAPATLLDSSVWILRPLLGARREELRSYLRQRNVGWIEDQSNVDVRWERARTRMELKSRPKAEFEKLLETARSNAALRSDLGRRAASLIRSHARQPESGLLHLAPALLETDSEAALYILRILIAVSGGAPRLPDEERTRALLMRAAVGPVRATLSRSLIASRRDGVWISREHRGLPAPGPAIDGMVWDGRFLIRAGDGAVPSLIAPAGASADAAKAGNGLPSSLLRSARACMPVFVPGASPAERGWTATPVLSPWSRFLPSFDLEVARAVAELTGAPGIPDLPCAGHNVTQA
ncbi:tRNA lysidine(34) synthetase TilS [Pseudaminobacter sp. 19-2017]|uniref:tRNA(Ile)-lysidine synthase n=1 Tax=Pseudaminobacter soli (ex Zhang et al. 2022) TaxID=2831468 RepID=A0A942DYM4_9HYPH|nr:tRNA lysidine(34) synthetase TilS [Pseudaminobacter soli]MBS3647786.1 tRNA lysidine(34) synthetase TilS [Pseudaminobacter soli]